MKAEFNNAKLENANFSVADLRGVVFNGAVLTNAIFMELTSAMASAISATCRADLGDAILNSAMLLKSKFQGANVTGQDCFAVLDREQALQLCKSAVSIQSLGLIRESLGCP